MNDDQPVLGDVSKIVSGNSFKITDTASQTLSTFVQVPSGVTKFSIYAFIKFAAGVGTHGITVTLKRELSSGLVASQTIWNPSFIGVTTGQWVWIDSTLVAQMQPSTGVVEKFEIQINVGKSSPRTNAASTVGYWDGLGAIYLGFR